MDSHYIFEKKSIIIISNLFFVICYIIGLYHSFNFNKEDYENGKNYNTQVTGFYCFAVFLFWILSYTLNKDVLYHQQNN